MKVIASISIDPEVLTAAKARCKHFGLNLSGTVTELLAGFCELDEGLLTRAAMQFQKYELRPAEVIGKLLEAFCEEEKE